MPHKQTFLPVRLLVLTFTLVLTVQQSYAQQEICANGLDDDLDGLIDQFDPDCGDADADGIADAVDLDCDNDGILDLTEIECVGVPYDMIVWSHNGTDATAPSLFQPALINVASSEATGSGLVPNYLSSVMQLTGAEASNLQTAINSNDYLSYGFQPSSAAGAMKVTAAQIGRIAVPGVVGSQNFGYWLAVQYSIDGFQTAVTLVEPEYIDTALTASYERIDLPLNVSHLLLEPQHNYEFRVYLFGHDQTGPISLDDFRFIAVECAASLDQDNDGVKNWFDLDSDNDGIYDVVEAGTGHPQVNGRLVGGVDTNGIPLVQSTGLGTVVNSPYDSDQDGLFDFVDSDSDGDLCYDVLEAGHTDPDFNGQVGDSTLVTDSIVGVVLNDSTAYGLPQDENGNGVSDFRETTTPALWCDSSIQLILASGNCTLAYAPTLPLVTGACGMVDLTYNNGQVGVDSFSVGLNTVTWSMADQTGNSLSCTQEITVLDLEPPSAYCYADTFDLGGATQFELIAAHVDAGSLDNCSIVQQQIVPNILAGEGLHTAQYIVTDAAGNSDTCLSMIYLTDTLNVVEVSITMLLEGAYDQQTGLMRDDLRVRNEIPLIEPYFELGFTHMQGIEEIAPLVLHRMGPNAIVDWVLVELRDWEDASVILFTRSALLLRNGQVVDLDGVSPVRFLAPDDNYFVAVKHRNHLGVMSIDALDFGAPQLVDFTSDTQVAWGFKPLKSLGGVHLLWSGNTTNDGILSYNGANNDRDEILNWLNGIPTDSRKAYASADVNMDGYIRYAGAGNDRDIILQNIGSFNAANTRSEQLP